MAEELRPGTLRGGSSRESVSWDFGVSPFESGIAFRGTTYTRSATLTNWDSPCPPCLGGSSHLPTTEDRDARTAFESLNALTQTERREEGDPGASQSGCTVGSRFWRR